MAWTLLLQLTLLLSYTWLISTPASATNVNTSCPDHCGEVPIPYPFGIGSSCSRNRFFNLNCNNSYTPPRPFWGSLETTNITLEGQMFIKSWIAEDCYNESGRSSYGNAWVSLFKNGPFSFSNTRNKFVAIGCDTNAFITGYWGQNFSSGCTTYCTSLANVINGTCSGIGCCQTSIPPGIKYFDINIRSYDKHSGILDFNPCSYAFLVDQDNFNFSVSDLFYNSSYSSEYIRVPVVLDWAVSNETCESARRNSTAFACQSENGDCYYPANSPGYRCRCNEGYEGNPYLKQGCQDIDECYTGTHECGEGAKCSNTVGSYQCHCGNGTLVNATQSCLTISATKFKLLEKITIGVGVSVFFIIIAIGWIFWVMKKRQLIKLKEKFFKENGGVLLQEHINSHGVALGTKIFSAEELEKATNNYDDSRIVGRGGYGIVYKGILLDQTVVAIKKSKIADKTQTEQFINEVFILSQTNHRNVVKLLGICLETEVPLLVYEFVTNGTLYHHIHDEAGLSSLSLDDRLRIASETAGALAYLHFSASMPIFHRDVKSANILLDKNMNAKVSDFGASRLVPLDQTQLTTLVQGTLGYLDPEYFHTGQLTEKSDVYSFGVVLVELLTGAKPICPTRTQEEKNLSSYFLSSLKENRLFGILPVRVVDEGNSEQIIAVAELAKRCLKLTGEERPTMKEVETELEGLRRFTKHSSIQNNNEETQILPSESFVEAYSNGGCVIEQDSLPNRSISGLEIGR